jgi:hypothetical protein
VALKFVWFRQLLPVIAGLSVRSNHSTRNRETLAFFFVFSGIVAGLILKPPSIISYAEALAVIIPS